MIVHVYLFLCKSYSIRDKLSHAMKKWGSQFIHKWAANMRKPAMWILTRSDTNQAVQPLEMARDLKFCGIVLSKKRKQKLPRSWSASLFFTYADCWFSHDAAQINLRSSLCHLTVKYAFWSPPLSFAIQFNMSHVMRKPDWVFRPGPMWLILHRSVKTCFVMSWLNHIANSHLYIFWSNICNYYNNTVKSQNVWTFLQIIWAASY